MAKVTKDPKDPTTTKREPARRNATGTRAALKTEPSLPQRTDDKANRPVADPVTVRSGSRPSHDEIARRAYEIFLRRGRTGGHDKEDWLEAERQLRGSGAR